MAPTLVSVIVPVYNGARFLGACIESLLEQDHPAIEVVVVDDGSTDGSAAIAHGYDGVRVVERPHEGLAPTRNAGLQAATGPLIGFCDSDDRWKPTKARRQLLVEYANRRYRLRRQGLELEPELAKELTDLQTQLVQGYAPA